MWIDETYRKDRQRNYKRDLRQRVITAYGGKCVCCGEARYVFLELDHVNGDGADHRRQLKGISPEKTTGMSKIYIDLIRKGFPSGCQVLCANCHRAKTVGVVCPHKTPAVR